MRGSTFVSCVLALSCACGAASAASLESFDVPAGCPTAAQFTATVQGSAPQRFASSPARLRVTARIEGALYVGELAILTDGAVTLAREIRGARCEEVLDALGLVAGVSIESELDETKEASPAPAPVAPLVITPAPPVSRPIDVSPPPPPSPSPSRIERRSLFELGVGARGSSGIATSIVPSLGAFVTARGADGAWRPVLRIGIAQDLPGGGPGDTRMMRTLGVVSACLARRLAPGLEVGPCLGGGVGRLIVVSEESASERRLWLSGAFDARAHLELGARTALELGVGIELPFRRYSVIDSVHGGNYQMTRFFPFLELDLTARLW